MVGKTSNFANDWLKLIFNATPIANIADNAASSPLTVLYASLHDGVPTNSLYLSGAQTAWEVSYTGYSRVAINRNSGAWTVTGNSVSPNSPIIFPTCTASSDSAEVLGIGTDATGTGRLLWFGAILPFALNIQVGYTIIMDTSTVITEV